MNNLLANDEITLLITGCISPVKGQLWLCIGDESIRLRQYVESIKFYIDSSDLKKIVFCENSGFVYNECDSLKKYALQKGKELEWLSFKGNESSVRKYGKGAGEDEIYLYAFENSKLLKSSLSFVKVTGRLIVTNINEIVCSVKKNVNYFNRDIYRPHCEGVDTRFYVVDKVFFQNNLLNCYVSKEKNKMTSQTLEDIYFKLLDGRYRCLKGFPIIKGISAGNGRNYSKENKSIMCFFNYVARLNLFNLIFRVEWFVWHAYNKIKNIMKRFL